MYRIKYDRVIENTLTMFVSMTNNEIDCKITEALQIIGEFAGADRSYIFLISEDGLSISNTHEWCAGGIEPQINNLQQVPVNSIPWLMDRIKTFDYLYIPCIEDMPPEADVEKEHLKSQSIKSMVNILMLFEKKLIGFIGFDAVKSKKQFYY